MLFLRAMGSENHTLQDTPHWSTRYIVLLSQMSDFHWCDKMCCVGAALGKGIISQARI